MTNVVKPSSPPHVMRPATGDRTIEVHELAAIRAYDLGALDGVELTSCDGDAAGGPRPRVHRVGRGEARDEHQRPQDPRLGRGHDRPRGPRPAPAHDRPPLQGRGPMRRSTRGRWTSCSSATRTTCTRPSPCCPRRCPSRGGSSTAGRPTTADTSRRGDEVVRAKPMGHPHVLPPPVVVAPYRRRQRRWGRRSRHNDTAPTESGSAEAPILGRPAAGPAAAARRWLTGWDRRRVEKQPAGAVGEGQTDHAPAGIAGAGQSRAGDAAHAARIAAAERSTSSSVVAQPEIEIRTWPAPASACRSASRCRRAGRRRPRRRSRHRRRARARAPG